MKRKNMLLCGILATTMIAGSLAGCAQNPDAGKETSSNGVTTEAAATTEASATTNAPADETEAPSKEADEKKDGAKTEEEKGIAAPAEGTDVNGFKLVWQDNFDGTELDTSSWNYEYHEPGWVNNELQEYVDAAENVYVKDGALVIQALKTENEDGTVSYTSGRVNTQNKHDYTYGRFEISAKMPIGDGFLPAIWMMPTDENLYGQWPKCGEIDIAEVLGNQTSKLYSTVHYGYPHNQGQGNYSLKLQRYSDEYHVYACEWEPGEIRFYVDGLLYHKENDWFTARDGFGEVTYPAPFDQPFYLILNLAVGGDWPGNPTEKTTFDEKAQLCVDYVRIYEKDSYNEDVEKPEKVLNFREPDETGNYVLNTDFSDTEDDIMTDGGWYFMTQKGGKGTATIEDGVLVIESTEEGTEDYSVQLVQAKIPMIRGHKYRLSFDMKADEDRACITAVTAPTAGWQRYLKDTTFDVTTDWQNYTFDFIMQADDDDNGRVEFNMGHRKSTATLYLKNVRLEFLGEESMETDENCLPDGNFIYNGEFQEGKDRLDFWEVTAPEDVKTYVSNINCIREFVAEVPDSVTSIDAVQLVQKDVSLYGGKNYKFSFDAYGDKNQKIEAMIAGQKYEIDLSADNKNYEFLFTTADDIAGAELVFNLGVAGTVHLDNVKVMEDALLINGDFLGQMTGFEVYTYTPTDVYYVVDNLNENAALCVEISDTGDQDWKIQVKQNDIVLEKGATYKLSLDMKSNLDRKVMYALQRDGSSDDNWQPYVGGVIVDVNGDYQHFESEFTMEFDTDEHTILSISLGSVDGIRITDKHTVAIDNIVLERIS